MLIINIDDDIDDREMFRAAINAIDPDITCLQFESGIKALIYITRPDIVPDCVFIDINMPKMDGYECVEQIRLIPGNDQLLIVMYSTAFNPKKQDSFQDANLRYIKKTSSFSELVQSIKTLVLDLLKVSVEKQKK